MHTLGASRRPLRRALGRPPSPTASSTTTAPRRDLAEGRDRAGGIPRSHRRPPRPRPPEHGIGRPLPAGPGLYPGMFDHLLKRLRPRPRTADPTRRPARAHRAAGPDRRADHDYARAEIARSSGSSPAATGSTRAAALRADAEAMEPRPPTPCALPARSRRRCLEDRRA